MSFDLKLKQGDLAIGSDGDLAIVENSEKLTQEVLKILTTRIGANPFFPWYGSPIDKSLIGNAFEERFVAAVASNQVRGSLENLQRLQEEELKKGVLITPQEQIAAIQDIDVRRNTVDPRFYSLTLTVLSKAFTRVNTNLTVSL